MPAANAVRTSPLAVELTLDPALLDAVSITHRQLGGRMTLEQAFELLTALQAALGVEGGTDDDADCGDPDCPGPHLCEQAPRPDCGDPDCSCPECPSGAQA